MKMFSLAAVLCLIGTAATAGQLPHATVDAQGNVTFSKPVCVTETIYYNAAPEGAPTLSDDGLLTAHTIAVPSMIFGGDCKALDQAEYASFREIRVGTLYHN